MQQAQSIAVAWERAGYVDPNFTRFFNERRTGPVVHGDTSVLIFVYNYELPGLPVFEDLASVAVFVGGRPREPNFQTLVIRRDNIRA